MRRTALSQKKRKRKSGVCVEIKFLITIAVNKESCK